MTKKTTATAKPLRLTKGMKESLIRAIISDIPKPNFKKEEAALEKKLIAELPESVRRVYNNNGTKHYINQATFRISAVLRSPTGDYRKDKYETILALVLPNNGSQSICSEAIGISASGVPQSKKDISWGGWVTKDIRDFALKVAEAWGQYHKVTQQVEAAVNSCANTKALRDRHPHFNSYTDKLEAEFRPAPVSNLPDDQLARTLEGLGWPDKAEASATKNRKKKAA